MLLTAGRGFGSSLPVQVTAGGGDRTPRGPAFAQSGDTSPRPPGPAPIVGDKTHDGDEPCHPSRVLDHVARTCTSSTKEGDAARGSPGARSSARRPRAGAPGHWVPLPAAPGSGDSLLPTTTIHLLSTRFAGRAPAWRHTFETKALTSGCPPSSTRRCVGPRSSGPEFPRSVTTASRLFAGAGAGATSEIQLSPAALQCPPTHPARHKLCTRPSRGDESKLRSHCHIRL
jgi:hypothetical protein